MNYNLVHNEANFITSRSDDRKYLNIKPTQRKVYRMLQDVGSNRPWYSIYYNPVAGPIVANIL